MSPHPYEEMLGLWSQGIAAWGRAVSGLSALQTRFFRALIDQLPAVAEQRLDALTFSQLSRLVHANWEEELRRFSEASTGMLHRTRSADPSRVAKLFESMFTEYLQDLRSMKPDSFDPDFGSLATAWRKLLTGTSDEQSDKIVGRFVEALAVKIRHGAEYYADPDSTPVGQTPREVVYRQGKIELHRYSHPDAPAEKRGAPVLIVYSVINKSFIEDLVPGFSFVEHLLAQGLDVYLVEWGPTEPGDRTTTLDSYIEPGLTGCVEAIQAATGCDKVSLFGHCIGGNLALMYAALHPGEVARLITLTTPATAAEGGVVAVWTDREVFPVDRIVDTFGHMPAKLIRYTFMALKPYYEMLKWKMFLENLGDDRVMSLFYPVDRWANENVDIPGEVFRKFIQEVFHEDRFRRGETRIRDRRVDLRAITCPFLNLAATRDWIVPLDSARILNDLVGSRENHFVPIEGAHVGIMIDPRARPLWSRMSDFLLESSPPNEGR